MNITDEQVERLADYSGASRAKARAALVQADGDLLDALRILQTKHHVPQQEDNPFSRRVPEEEQFFPRPAASSVPDPFTEEIPEPALNRALKTAWRFLVDNALEVYHPENGRRLSVPLAALIALLVIAWHILLVCVIVSVCLGWRFRFTGPRLGREDINRVVSDLDDAAEHIRDSVAENLNFKKK